METFLETLISSVIMFIVGAGLCVIACKLSLIGM